MEKVNRVGEMEAEQDEQDAVEVVALTTVDQLARGEIDVQIATAKKYPRAIRKFVHAASELATLSESVAEECMYALSRGGKVIEGPSARFAEIIASAWGNCRAGARVVDEDGRFVTCQGVFFDLERNTSVTMEVKRRITDASGRRYKDDMIGVTANAAASIAHRNAVLKGIPKALWHPVYLEARKCAVGDAQTLRRARRNGICIGGNGTGKNSESEQDMIISATDAQWRRVDEIKQEYIDSATAQYSDSEIVDSARQLLGRIGYRGAVLVADSPLSSLVMSYMGGLLKSDLQLVSQLSSQLYSQLSSQLVSQLGSQLDSQLGSQLVSQLVSQLYSQLYSQLVSQLQSQLHLQLSQFSQLELDSLPRRNSWWWYVLDGYYAGAEALGCVFDKKLRLLRNWAAKVPFVCGHTVATVSRRPAKISWQDGRLHCETGMSVEFRDGWGVYSIGGVLVDEQIVMRPATQTVEQIRKEENQEVKRIRIERFGWPRYLKEVGAVRIDSRRNDIEGTRESVYRTPDGMKTLVCVCPSTAKVFALEVDPSAETCVAAQHFLSSGFSSRIISAS